MAGGYCPLFVDARPLRLMCSARFGGDIHASLDAQVDGKHSLLDQLEAPAAELASGSGAEQLPAAQATALRLTLLEGLSLRAAGLKLGISAMAVQRAQKKAIAALRLQLVGGG